MYIIIYTKYPSLVRSYKNIAKRQKSEVRSQIQQTPRTSQRAGVWITFINIDFYIRFAASPCCISCVL